MADPDWLLEPLDRRHDRSGFDCGNVTLNDWLTTKARQFGERNLARTYVLVERGRVVVRGYYAISNHAVTFDVLPDEESKGLPRIDIPVVLLGRLAVDRTVQGRGLGEYLLIDAIHRAEALSRQIGVRAVEVDAIDEPAVRFYQKYGFLSLQDDPRHLFLPIHLVRKLKPRP